MTTVPVPHGSRSAVLTVSGVIEETPGSRSLVFAVPEVSRGEFEYQPGQFLTLRIPSDRTGSVARCYRDVRRCSAVHGGGVSAPAGGPRGPGMSWSGRAAAGRCADRPVRVGGRCQTVGVQLRYNFRLYPSSGQQQALARAFGCARVVYNDALRVRREAYENDLPYPSNGEYPHG